MKATLEFDLSHERGRYDMAINAPDAFERLRDGADMCHRLLEKFPEGSDVRVAVNLVLDTISNPLD